MSIATQIAVSTTWVWLGMVLAISFLEAPLKFRTPGLELRVGLAIGRIVFRALNTVEVVWAVVIAICLAVDPPAATATIAAAAAGAVLLVQLMLVRPRLTERSNRVLAGEDLPRSGSHRQYIVLEVTKVVALITAGTALLAT